MASNPSFKIFPRFLTSLPSRRLSSKHSLVPRQLQSLNRYVFLADTHQTAVKICGYFPLFSCTNKYTNVII